MFPFANFQTSPRSAVKALPCLSRPLGTSEPCWIVHTHPSPRVCSSWWARAAWGGGGGGGKWQRVCVCVPLSNYPCLSCCIEVRSCVTDSPAKSFHLMRSQGFLGLPYKSQVFTQSPLLPHPPLLLFFLKFITTFLFLHNLVEIWGH